MTEKISIIVPVYKVENYLHKCVDSILNQTYTNLEIILVDDGSPDACPQMCDEYALLDSRVKVIHKENGGLSDARNAGLDIATGEYIGFVDSDDYVLPNMYEKLYSRLKQDDADLSICSIQEFDDEGNLIETPMCPLHEGMISPGTVFEELSHYGNEHWYYEVAWNKLYKRQIFNDLRFPKGKIHEDSFTIHHILSECSKVTVTEERLYMYLQRANSITGSQSSKGKSLDATEAIMDRYYLYLSKGYQKWAHSLLIMAYWEMCNNRETYLRPAIKKAARKQCRDISRELIKTKNLRGVKLLLIYYGV